MNKSNIVIFRKGAYLGARERWVYDDCMTKVVNFYKYLGISFSTRLSFYHACQDLVSRAKRTLLCIMSKLYRIDCNWINVFLKIFDVQVQPIVLYGAGIWGLESCSSVIDNVHLFGLKRYLGMDRRNPKWSCVWRSWKVSYSNWCADCLWERIKCYLTWTKGEKLTGWLMFVKLYVQTAFLMFGIIRVWGVWMHLLGSSDKDLLTFDGKFGMTM